MTRSQAESSTFRVPLTASAHAIAEQFRKQQTQPTKAKQVYLNTLAVSAVDFYLRCMGTQTDWEASQSCNLVMQALMDVADLEVKQRGKLECRPLMPATQVIQIPPEVWSDRIGYVGVQLDPSLREATLLGFTRTVGSGEVWVNQLRSLEALLEHLNPSRQPDRKQPVHLSQWLENLCEEGWQSLETLLAMPLSSVRSGLGLRETSVKRAKLIDFGRRFGSQAIALLVAIAPEAHQKVSIVVQVHPVGRDAHLPPNLSLSLRSEHEETLQAVYAQSHDHYIQLKRFHGSPGESFKIQVTCGQATLTERFVI